MMAPATGDAAALRHSWAAVEKLGDHAAACFYALLFTLEPDLRARFPAAMSEQRHRFLAALGRIVSHVDDPPALAGFLGRLGRDHHWCDMEPEHYPMVGRALRETLARLLGPDWTPALAASWERLSDQVAGVMSEAARRGPGRWDAEIVAHERRSGDIAVITARVTGGLLWRAGQSVAVESHRRPGVWRHLSPANVPRDDGTVEFHVRAVPGGQLSPALVYQAQVGDVLRLAGPVGDRLTVPPRAGPDLLLLAGGTGLAPLKAIVDQLGQERDRRNVTLIAGTAYRYELYDLDALWRLARRHKTLTVLAALSADPALGEPHTVAEAAARSGSWHDRGIYVCGSPAMVAGTCQALTAQGYSPAQLHVEEYDATPYPPPQVVAAGWRR
jgi:NAD(P)H-flavin reductase